jgi:biopolymer transport protein ExbD
MSMNVGTGGDDDAMCDMNTTPLIDVMLVLLVMLIITIPVQTHAVKLDMPRADATPPTNTPVVVDLEIDFDGTPLWNGRAVPNRATLNRYFETVASQVNQPEIHLRPNRLAKYDAVARTLADAQRLGVKKIGFVGTNEYVE